MKKFLNMLLILMVLVAAGGFIQGCGHGRDADPYEVVMTGGFDWDSLEESEPTYSSIESLSKATIDALADDLYSIVQKMIADEDLNVGRTMPGYRGYSTFDPTNIFTNVNSDSNGNATIYGEGALLISQIQRCAFFANFTIDYALYFYADKAEEYYENRMINGSGDVRLIATSRSCSFAADINLDLKMSGNLAVNGITIKELEFTATFQSTNALNIEINAAVVDTPKGIRYCYPYSFGGVFCSTLDKRIYEFDDETSCTDSVGGGHVECDLSESSLLQGIWMFSGDEIPYEVDVKCSPDGIWSPPCPLDGSFDICPHGSTCSASRIADWGPGLEDYGICTCDYQ